MSDHADNSDNKIYRVIASGLAAVRRAPSLQPDFRCYFCDEPVGKEFLFCNSDCRDDFDRHAAAARRAGKQSL
jgi:hypothetical protein